MYNLLHGLSYPEGLINIYSHLKKKLFKKILLPTTKLTMP